MTVSAPNMVGFRRPAWLPILIVALMAALLFVPRAAFAADGSGDDYNSAEVVANCAPPRACVDPTTENLRRALTTAPNEAMFWTGRTVVNGVEQNSMDVAAHIAAAEGGTTLEMALERGNIRMPSWDDGPAGRPVWTQASQMFAQLARGSVRVIRGQNTRPDNIWDTEEFDAIQRNPNVNIVTQVSILPDGTRPRHAIYTRTNAARAAWAAPTPRLSVTNPTTTCVRSVEVLLTYFHVVATASPTPTSDPNVISPTALQWASWGNLYSSVRTYYDNGHDAAVANSTLANAAQTLRYTDEARTAAASGTLTVAGLETMLDPSNCHPTAINGLDAWSVSSFSKRSLRVLPLGESITAGTGSSDGAGYRKDLEDDLTASGNAVEYVGSLRSGNFSDPSNEGHPNATIGDLDTVEHTAAAQYHPNVVLINAGENDIEDNVGLGDAPAQLKRLVDDTLADNSDATVIVSTIRVEAAGDLTAPYDAFNEAVHQLAIDEQAVGHKVLVADMSRIPSADMADGVHPNDAGYVDMADEFYGAMTAAADMIKDAALDPGDGRSPTGTLRIMVVGDSMSQGREGDWTWRYRLWQWFTSQGVKVQFVGPYTGTREPDAPTAPVPPVLQGEVAATSGEVRASGGYAAGALPWDSHHFSVWGRQAAQDKKQIWAEVSMYQPDMLLVGLGFNDMGWFVSGAQGTLDSMKTLVDEARSAKPDIEIALANVPQRTHIGGRDDLPIKTAAYDDMLRGAIPTWSTATSPVKLVDWAGNYQCGPDSCPAGYDGLHPNALGEFEIAQAYERTLHDAWGIGHSVPDVPTAAIPARPTPVPSNVVAAAVPSGVTVTWDKVYGARSYTVRSRFAGSSWTETTVTTNRFDTVWTQDGWQWEYQVRTDNLTDGQSEWSPMVSAVAHPQTAPPPTDVVTNATATGLDVSWSQPTGPHTDTIDRYQVIIWDKDTPGAYTEDTAVQGRAAHIDGLLPGHRYQVWVVTWNAAGGGWPGDARPVTIGTGTPAAPTGLQVTSTNGTTVKLTWNASSGAAAYRVWVRNINDGSASTADPNATTMDTTSGVAYLFPGVWNYEFCVTAINGAAESGKSNCVVAPKPAGS